MAIKGIFFTLSGLLLLAYLLSVQTSVQLISPQLEQAALDNRLESINGFVQNVERDAEFALYASTYRAIIAMIQEMETQGTYITNVQTTYQELLENGSLSTAPILLMENNTVTDWAARLEARAQILQLDANFSLENLTLYQHNPWYVSANATLTLTVIDAKTQTRWQYQTQVSQDVPIQDFPDPVYIIGSSNVYANTIQKTPYKTFVKNNNVANLTDHLENQYYISFSGAPNYIMRLEGDLTPANDTTGIESLVDLDALDLVLPIDDKTNVDFLYFSEATPAHYSVAFMSSTFTLDNRTNTTTSRHQLYNVSHLIS